MSPKDTGSEIFPRASTLFAPNPINGISAGWRRFLSMFILSKVLEKIMSAELPVSTSIFFDGPTLNVGFDDHCIGVGVAIEAHILL